MTENSYLELRSNSFTPEFLKWILPTFNLDIGTILNGDLSQKSTTKRQTVYSLMRRLNEPSHLDPHCLQNCLSWSKRVKGLMSNVALGIHKERILY